MAVEEEMPPPCAGDPFSVLSADRVEVDGPLIVKVFMSKRS